MPARSFKAIPELVKQAKRAAVASPNLVNRVADLIKLAGDDGVDPYLLLDALVEGVAHTIEQHIIQERQLDTARECLRVLALRLTSARR
jgi:hypothetical protein